MPWKVDLKSRSLAQGAVYPNISVALLHDAVDGRESEARALSHALGGKERLEDMRDGLSVHASARVCNREHHVAPWLGTWMFPCVRMVQFYVGGSDLEFPARRHGIPGIHSQIHDHLLDLALVGFDISKLRIQSQGNVDILAQQARQHFFHVRHQRIQAQDRGCQYLLPAESQQLSSQGSRALARFFDLGGKFVVRLALVQGLLQYAAV